MTGIQSRALAGARRTALRTAALLLLGAFASLTITARPTQAMRHLRLVKSFPAKDTVLTSSPDAIRLWLSEPTQAPVSKVSIASSTGEAIALDALTRDVAKDAPLVAKLTKPIGAGQYTVTWKAMSKDGHVVNGTFGFRVVAAN